MPTHLGQPTYIYLTMFTYLYLPIMSLGYNGPYLIVCRLPLLDGYVTVCLVLTVEVYDLMCKIGF